MPDLHRISCLAHIYFVRVEVRTKPAAAQHGRPGWRAIVCQDLVFGSNLLLEKLLRVCIGAKRLLLRDQMLFGTSESVTGGGRSTSDLDAVSGRAVKGVTWVNQGGGDREAKITRRGGVQKRSVWVEITLVLHNGFPSYR